MSTIKEYLSELSGRRVTVIGMGVSNIPLIKMLLRAGVEVTVRDRSPRERLAEQAQELESLGARLILGEDYLKDLPEELIFRTPGLSPNNPELLDAVQRGAALSSEMEVFFQTCPGRLIGVTGSDGKTTTTTIIAEFLKEAGKNVYVGGNIGRPLLADVADMVEEDYAVLELSSFQLMTMDQSPHIAVVTNISPNHLDYHHTMEEYRDAKGLLFRQCETAVLNLDDEAGRWYRERLSCPVFTYSENKDAADLTAKNIRLFPGHVEFEAVSRQDIQRIHLPIPGGFTIYNALAAASCGLCLGLELGEIAAALRCARGVKGRVEVVPTPTAYTVLIDYAHSPNALENVLLTARDFTAGRLVCLFGCGGDRDRTKRPLMGAVVRELADVAVVTSDNPRTEDPWAILEDILAGMGGPGGEIHIEPDRPQAIRWALAQGRPGDVIVLAGKGHETYQEVNGVQYPMDEREIVAEYFEKQAKRRERAGNFPAGVV